MAMRAMAGWAGISVAVISVRVLAISVSQKERVCFQSGRFCA